MVGRMHGKRRQNEHPHIEERKLMQLDASDERLLFKEQGLPMRLQFAKDSFKSQSFLVSWFLILAPKNSSRHRPTHLKAIQAQAELKARAKKILGDTSAFPREPHGLQSKGWNGLLSAFSQLFCILFEDILSLMWETKR